MSRLVLLLCAGVLAFSGCTREPGSTVLTRGTLVIEADEALEPVMRTMIEEFRLQYPDAQVTVRVADARAAVSNFAADSVRLIVIARALNKEERDALASAQIRFDEYHVAQTAVAVIAHPDNPQKEMTVGELDSIFSGERSRWRGSNRVIEPVIAGLNSSTNEAFRGKIMGGKRFALSAAPMDLSGDVIEFVRTNPGGIGIVGLNWLQGIAGGLTVMSLGRPGFRPDSTQKPGAFYSPAQAYVFLDYYPVTSPIYIYNREVTRDLGLGFIAYVNSVQGQKVFQNAGLVPKTMPVRLIQISSGQVQQQ